MKIKIFEDEVWYPAVSAYGTDMPYSADFSGKVQMKNNPTVNQMTPLLLSNKGRYIYKEDGFIAIFAGGEIEIDEPVIFKEGLGNLREAYKAAAKAHFGSGSIKIAKKLVESPVYNTWMYAPFDITQEKVLAYARDILALGLPAGTLVIDDKWCKDYGDWRFDEEKFPNPEEMIKALHDMGFSLMLWVCPYLSFEAKVYEYCKENSLLLTENNEIYKLKWWNETSATFDLRKKESLVYMENVFEELVKLGVDGFKADGGDSLYYLNEHEPDRQSFLWAELASKYSFNELRADFNTPSLNVFERLCDKKHSWGKTGIAALIPDALALGLGGHPFFAPDMIGGGEVSDIREKCELKRDIFLAHSQVATLFPSMQFSVLPSYVLGEDIYKLKVLLDLRKKLMPYIKELFDECCRSKEPFVRLLEYVFPHEGFEKIKDVFILGDKYMVVPVTRENEKKKLIRFPKGRWKLGTKVYENGEEIELDLSIDNLLVIERM